VLPRTLAVGIIFATLTGLTALICEEPKPADKPAKSDEKATKADPDILAMVKEWNSDKFASPPTKFREGKVVSRKLASTRAISTSAAAWTSMSPYCPNREVLVMCRPLKIPFAPKGAK
jgi:hypothetical protein